MSQATLSGGPYRNSNLFSNYFLDSRVQHTDGWDCDDEAESAFENLTRLWEDEGEFVAAYNEDELLDHFMDEIVYELYGLTQQEIEVVEEAASG